jgi:multicomponent Na+:H+ antiporter subunit G
MSELAPIATGVLMLLGGVFCLLGAVGLLRMPDVYTRLQAATKTGTLGVGCLMLGIAIHFGELGVSVRALLVVAFLFLTAPVAGHVIARAAYLVRTPIWNRTAVDEWGDSESSEAGDRPSRES